MALLIIILQCLVVACYSSPVDHQDHVPLFINGRPKGGLLGKPKVQNTDAYTDAKPQWFTQTLNHFDGSDLRTWNQKYYVNASMWKTNGPVFMMIGGEGPLSARWVSVGSMVEYAGKYGALVLALEHRFYGESHPLGDMSLESLKYLSSEQALADLATFHEAMIPLFSLTSSNRWIMFGGSYPGALSAWFRYKYPHLAFGSIASSAPINAQLDFPQYLEVSTASLGSEKCRSNVAKATAKLENYTKTEAGLKYLSLQFKTCKPLTLNSNDVPQFVQGTAGNFFGVIQYNKDNREFEGAVGTNITVDTLCAIMNNEGIGDELQRYAAVNNMMLKTYSQACLDSSYDDYVSAMKKKTWQSAAAEGGRQWLYQTCTEFGFYQTTDSKEQVFGTMFPLSFSIKQCMDIFGTQFNASSINKGIDWTNTNYGGYSMSAERIVFPNGSIDPWHALSFITDGKLIKAVYINGTAHCANMYPSSNTDSPELTEARLKIKAIIGEWLASSPYS